MLLRFSYGWKTAHLTPLFDISQENQWPKSASARSARLQWVVLTALAVVTAVQIYTGGLTPKDFLMYALHGRNWRPAGSAVPPARTSLELIAQEENKSLPKLIDRETELTTVSSMAGALLYTYRLVNLLASQVTVEMTEALALQM